MVTRAWKNEDGWEDIKIGHWEDELKSSTVQHVIMVNDDTSFP